MDCPACGAEDFDNYCDSCGYPISIPEIEELEEVNDDFLDVGGEG